MTIYTKSAAKIRKKLQTIANNFFFFYGNLPHWLFFFATNAAFKQTKVAIRWMNYRIEVYFFEQKVPQKTHVYFQKWKKLQIWTKKLQKYLQIQKKCCIFAPCNGQNAQIIDLHNGQKHLNYALCNGQTTK